MTKQLTKQIADALNEPNLALIRKIIMVIGAERTQAFLTQTQETMGQGGLLRKDGEQRTAGGVFFYLVRVSISKEEVILPSGRCAAPRRMGGAGSASQATRSRVVECIRPDEHGHRRAVPTATTALWPTLGGVARR